MMKKNRFLAFSRVWLQSDTTKSAQMLPILQSQNHRTSRKTVIEPKSKQEFSKDRKAFVKRHQIKSEV